MTLVGRCDEIVNGVRDIHQKDLCRPLHPLEVIAQTEHGGALGCLVTTNALEDAGAVMKGMGEDVDGCVLPIDKLAVHPDLVDRLYPHPPSPLSVGDGPAERDYSVNVTGRASRSRA